MGEKNNQPDTNNKSSLKFVLRALSSRNYRLYFGGQGVSLIGTWIQRVAQSWLVYQLTDSVFLLGLVGFSSQIPTFFAAPFAGVIVDRYNRYHILIATQILATIQALILAILVLTNHVQVWHIIVLGIFLGLVNAFDMPSRQSLLVELIERREDLSNAIALNSTMVNGARLLGPTVAGILIAVAGEGVCFLFNAISFLAVIIALFAMRLNLKPRARVDGNLLTNLKAGFKYAFGFSPIRSILLLLALMSIMGMPYMVLMPVFARDILHGGPHTMGYLMGSVGLGALVGALYLASRRTVVGLERAIAVASILFGGGLVAFSLSRNFWLSMLSLCVAGLGMMLQMSSSNTVLQTIVDDDKRGRVMSFYAMSFFGMAPLGSLMAGSLGSRIGTPYTVMIGGLLCVLGGLIFLQRLPALGKLIGRVYSRKGILPEVAAGLHASSSIDGRP